MLGSLHYFRLIRYYVVISAQISVVLLTETCIGIAPKKRKDCGYGGITPQECERKGCCFDDTIRDVNWCFYKGLS